MQYGIHRGRETIGLNSTPSVPDPGLNGLFLVYFVEFPPYESSSNGSWESRVEESIAGDKRGRGTRRLQDSYEERQPHKRTRLT